MVHIVTDPPSQTGGAAQQLLRLQNDFHARLAVETMHYLRGLQSALGPAAPGTVLVPRRGATLRATAEPGTQVRLHVEVANAQAVHCVVSPALSPLVAASGVTWFAAANVDPPYLLIAPGETEAAALDIAVPAALPTGDYRGVLLMHGAPDGVPVTIRVASTPTKRAVATKRPAKASAAVRKTPGTARKATARRPGGTTS